MNEEIIDQVKSLPPLSNTITEVQKIKDNMEIGLREIIKIVEKDPMETLNLINMANKPLYNNGVQIKTLQQALIMFGITKTFAILLENNVKRLFNINMQPYNISQEDFAKISLMQSALALNWMNLLDKSKEATDVFFFSALIQEVGKVIISECVLRLGEEEDFLEDIISTTNIEEIEEAYLEVSTTEVTTLLLNKWDIDEEVKDIIKNSLNPEDAPDKIKEYCIMLNVIRTIVAIHSPLSEDSIALGIEKAKYFGLDTEKLKIAIANVEID